MTAPDPKLQAAGTALRVRIGLQVGAAALLAGAAALLLTWLAERPGLRARIDWTAARDNTLGPASHAVIEKLQSDVVVDAFFTPLPGPLGAIGYEAQERTLRLLVLLRESSAGRVTFRQHDLASQIGVDAARARLQELGLRQVDPGGIVVVSMDARQAVLHVHGDLADIDPGDPRGEQGVPRPARLVTFRAEEALVSALLKVSLGDTQTVLFSVGHGERELDDTGLGGLSDLRKSLEGDGFKVDRWSSGKEGGRIPADCAVLAVIGPEQPFTEAEADAVREFVESGGRLVGAPATVVRRPAVEGDRTLPALLVPWGIRIATEGIVAEPRATLGQPLYGIPQCGEIRIGSDGLSAMSPVTESLKRADRYVETPYAMSLERTTPPPGGSVLTLLSSESASWRDVPNPPTAAGHDWKPAPDEARGPFPMAMTAVFRPPRTAEVRRVGAKDAQPETRILAIGSAGAFANASLEVNRDFLLNGFDWAVARDYRVHVEPKSRPSRRLDVASGAALAHVHLWTVFVLPGACLALGLFTWRRRRNP